MKQRKSKQKLFIKEILICFLSILLLTHYIEAQNYCDFIKKVQAYQDSVEICRDTSETNTYYMPNIIDSSTFDIDVYMQMFDKLKIRQGFECSVYFADYFLDGTPIIYVKEKDFDLNKYIGQKIIEKNVPNKDSVENNRRLFFNNFLDNPQRRAFNNVTPDNTEEGFLQYLLFNQMGELFALKWHSLEAQRYVICSDSEMIKIIEDYKDNNYSFMGFGTEKPSFQLFTFKIIDSINLFEIDSYIKIKMLPDKCFITWYELETHHGIFRRTYLIYKTAPYLVEKVFEEKLANINMNFNY